MGRGSSAGRNGHSGRAGLRGCRTKVGIDPKTRKLRRLTAEESAALDAMAAKQRKAKGARAKDSPTTYEINGVTLVELPDSMMIESKAFVGADGKVAVTHDDEPAASQGAER